jgi:hypothetical protein
MARLHWPAVLSSLEARVGRQITRHTVPRLHKRLEAIVRRDPGELTWKDGVSLPWGHMETLHLPTVHVQLDMATMVLEVSVHVHRFCCESRVR